MQKPRNEDEELLIAYRAQIEWEIDQKNLDKMDQMDTSHLKKGRLNEMKKLRKRYETQYNRVVKWFNAQQKKVGWKRFSELSKERTWLKHCPWTPRKSQ